MDWNPKKVFDLGKNPKSFAKIGVLVLFLVGLGFYGSKTMYCQGDLGESLSAQNITERYQEFDYDVDKLEQRLGEEYVISLNHSELEKYDLERAVTGEGDGASCYPPSTIINDPLGFKFLGNENPDKYINMVHDDYPSYSLPDDKPKGFNYQIYKSNGFIIKYRDNLYGIYRM